MVYLIYAQDTHLVKIGFAKDPEKRLKQLNTGNACDLVILKILEAGDRRVESELHKKFRHYRVNKEWFKFHECMLSEFDRLAPFFVIPKS